MQRCGCGEEDCDADRLWADFETCATTVARLYREPNWKVMQVAAAATTQLYKNGVDIHRKAYDRGFEEGKRAMAKELVSACGGKIDFNRLIEILQNGTVEDVRRTNSGKSTSISSEGAAAVQLFHQALTPAPGGIGSPGRGIAGATSSELSAFLTSQIARRKRSRSPSSPSSHVLKKLRKF